MQVTQEYMQEYPIYKVKSKATQENLLFIVTYIHDRLQRKTIQRLV